MVLGLCLIFFLSGASALIFEGLWLNLAGLTFGNSVWAASIVLSSFMAGLAIGGGLVAVKGYKVRNPIWLYAMIEITIGVSGLFLVLFLPGLTALLAPIFKVVGEQPFLINFIRGLFSFLLLIVPTTAMGATLPILVKALYSQKQNFGRVLGLLYGWNTFGAMIGVIANELFLIKYIGIQNAGAFAAMLNLLAAFYALKLSKRIDIKAEKPMPRKHLLKGLPFSAWRLLIACSLSGLIMIALEVVWFRFMILFFIPHSWNFAIMLAVVLGGISLGGIAASKIFSRKPDAHRFAPYLFFISGILVIVLYASFGWVQANVESITETIRITIVSIFFLFPVSFVSGIIFTFIGKALHRALRSETQASGLLALFNTAGGTIGAVLSGFILIPLFGVETSFFTLAIGYGLTGIVIMDRDNAYINRKYIAISTGVLILVMLAFPFGTMQKRYLNLSLHPDFRESAEQRVAYKEGVTETIQYLRQDLFGEPDFFRLVTNSYSMSGTNMSSKRYMKLFAYLPIALNGDVKNSLLICYGCGSTAKALTDTKSIEQIDVVDISKDVIKMSKIIYPDPKENPVNDPRMRVHIEDGRFFLQTTETEYDLITAEPPPPKNNGIVNLYTQEFFQLIHDRLAPGGITSYWLPVYQMKTSETKSIMKAFINVFPDSSVWTGGGFEWILLGIKAPAKQGSETHLVQQWEDPVVSKELQNLGLLSAAQLGSLFIADGKRLKQWISDARPLEDNYPRRLSYQNKDWKNYLKDYRGFLDPRASAINFIKSPFQNTLWPETMRHEIIQHFNTRGIVNELLMGDGMRSINSLVALHQCLHDPLLKEYIMWIFGSDFRAIDIISKKEKVSKDELLSNPAIYYNHLAAYAAYQKDYTLAEKYLGLISNSLPPQSEDKQFLFYAIFRMYFLYLQNNKEDADKVAYNFIHVKKTGIAERQNNIEKYQTWMIGALSSESIKK